MEAAGREQELLCFCWRLMIPVTVLSVNVYGGALTGGLMVKILETEINQPWIAFLSPGIRS